MEIVTGYCIEDLAVGMSASYQKRLGSDDIVAFANLSGDRNPIHLDEDYAAGTPFKTRIAHGMLTASLISTVLGTRLPGPGAIYLSQSLQFRAPVRCGELVTAEAEVSALDVRRRRVTLACLCRVGDTVVIDGEAKVVVPARG